MAEVMEFLSFHPELQVVLVCAVLGVLFAFIKNNILKGLLVLLGPFLASYSVFWSPVWFGNVSSGGYSSWSFIIFFYYFIGVLACVFSCLIVLYYKK